MFNSGTVDYIGPGRDAIIAYDYINLKFENNLNRYILIAAELEGNNLKVSFLFTLNNAQIDMNN